MCARKIGANNRSPEKQNGPVVTRSACPGGEQAPEINGSGSRCRIRRLHVTSYVRVTAGQADKVLRTTVPARARERQTARDWIIYNSAIDRLTAALVAAGVEVVEVGAAT